MENNNQLNHLAIILDGNGRWADKKGLARIKGHYEGGKKVKEIAIAASQRGIKRLSVYAFSTENWKRPMKEIEFIFKLPKEFLRLYLKDLNKNNIKIEYIGDLKNIPEFAKAAVNDLAEKTSHNTGLVLCFALNYGFYAEMIQAVQQIASKVKVGELEVEQIDEVVIENNLMNSTKVDLLIRTSGEKRISNFLMWQIAYSELYFTDITWPDFDVVQLDIALEEFQKRQRRFGGVG